MASYVTRIDNGVLHYLFFVLLLRKFKFTGMAGNIVILHHMVLLKSYICIFSEIVIFSLANC